VLKNITLSADEELIRRARQEADRRGTSLNAQFRQRLVAFTEQEHIACEFNDLMERLSYAQADGGFTREELNAR
jgi:hypothetical protein